MKTLEYFQMAYTGNDKRKRACYTRTGNALDRAGVETMGQLCAMHYDEIRNIRYVGANSMLVILEECKKYKLLTETMNETQINMIKKISLQ